MAGVGSQSGGAGGVRWAKDGSQSNKRMHATADTRAVIFLLRLGAARDARR